MYLLWRKLLGIGTCGSLCGTPHTLVSVRNDSEILKVICKNITIVVYHYSHHDSCNLLM